MSCFAESTTTQEDQYHALFISWGDSEMGKTISRKRSGMKILNLVSFPGSPKEPGNEVFRNVLNIHVFFYVHLASKEILQLPHRNQPVMGQELCLSLQDWAHQRLYLQDYWQK